MDNLQLTLLNAYHQSDITQFLSLKHMHGASCKRAFKHGTLKSNGCVLVHIISERVDNPAQTIGTCTNLSCMQALSALYVRLHTSQDSHYTLSLAYLLLRKCRQSSLQQAPINGTYSQVL